MDESRNGARHTFRQNRVMPVIRAFHASSDPSIEAFRSLTHFGTETAARHRASMKSLEGGTLYEVEFDVCAVLNVPDLSNSIKSGEHTWIRLVDQLYYDLRPRILSADERISVFEAGRGAGLEAERSASACMAALLRAKGYDAIAYLNDFEDPGSTSWIVLAPDRLRIISVSGTTDPSPRRGPRP